MIQFFPTYAKNRKSNNVASHKREILFKASVMSKSQYLQKKLKLLCIWVCYVYSLQNNGNKKVGSMSVSGKLPTFPSPNLTLTPTSFFGQNVWFGRGRWAVSEKRPLIQKVKYFANNMIACVSFTVWRTSPGLHSRSSSVVWHTTWQWRHPIICTHFTCNNRNVPPSTWSTAGPHFRDESLPRACLEPTRVNHQALQVTSDLHSGANHDRDWTTVSPACSGSSRSATEQRHEATAKERTYQWPG